MVEIVEEVVGDESPDAHIRRGAGDDRRHPVHVEETGGPGLEHLQEGQLRAPVDGFFVEAGLYGPDLVEPGLQGLVLIAAAHQGHRRMGVHIDQPGNDGLARSVDHAAGGNVKIIRNTRDPVSFDQDVRRAVVQLYAFEE